MAELNINTKLIVNLFDKKRISKIVEARRYYDNENEICCRKRMVVGPLGDPVEAKLLTNNRLSHAFVKKIVRQKVAYLMGKPFNIDGSDKTLVKKAEGVMGKAFKRTLRKVAKDAVLTGEGWLLAYYNEAGNLSFMRIKPESIGVKYTDDEQTIIEYLVRRYPKSKDGSVELIEQDAEKPEFLQNKSNFTWIYEVWTDKKVVSYKEETGKLIKISEKPHFNVNGKAAAFGRIPFIRFQYNDESQGILTSVKRLIDDYDLNTSNISNLLCDTPNSTRVIKGYRGQVEEIIRNLATFNTIITDPDSSIEVLQNAIETAATEEHLNRLRKDIYDCAFAVDTQEASQGDLSGVAIKFRYADLDLDCQEMGSNFSASLEEVCWFICEDLKAKGQGEHDPSTIKIIWAMEIIANDAETIQNLMNSVDLLSLETRVAQHPYVDNPKDELKRIAKEKTDEENGFSGEGARLANFASERVQSQKTTNYKPSDAEASEI